MWICSCSSTAILSNGEINQTTCYVPIPGRCRYFHLNPYHDPTHLHQNSKVLKSPFYLNLRTTNYTKVYVINYVILSRDIVCKQMWPIAHGGSRSVPLNFICQRSVHTKVSIDHLGIFQDLWTSLWGNKLDNNWQKVFVHCRYHLYLHKTAKL